MRPASQTSVMTQPLPSPVTAAATSDNGSPPPLNTMAGKQVGHEHSDGHRQNHRRSGPPGAQGNSRRFGPDGSQAAGRGSHQHRFRLRHRSSAAFLPAETFTNRSSPGRSRERRASRARGAAGAGTTLVRPLRMSNPVGYSRPSDVRYDAIWRSRSNPSVTSSQSVATLASASSAVATWFVQNSESRMSRADQ